MVPLYFSALRKNSGAFAVVAVTHLQFFQNAQTAFLGATEQTQHRLNHRVSRNCGRKRCLRNGPLPRPARLPKALTRRVDRRAGIRDVRESIGSVFVPYAENLKQESCGWQEGQPLVWRHLTRFFPSRRTMLIPGYRRGLIGREQSDMRTSYPLDLVR